MSVECPVHTRCFHSEYYVYFSRTTGGCFLFKRSKETPREFSVALQYYCTQITALMFSSVQSLSHVQLFAIPWTAAHQASRSITNSQSPPKPMSIKSVTPSNHLILSSPSPPAPNPSQHQGLSNESTLRMRWPKYWSFSFSISPSKERPGLISFRMDWLDLLAVQGTLKSLLQHHSSKALSFL